MTVDEALKHLRGPNWTETEFLRDRKRLENLSGLRGALFTASFHIDAYPELSPELDKWTKQLVQIQSEAQTAFVEKHRVSYCLTKKGST